MDSFQATIQQMLNEDKRRDTFKLLASLAGLKLNREQVVESRAVMLLHKFTQYIVLFYRFLLLEAVKNFLIVIQHK